MSVKTLKVLCVEDDELDRLIIKRAVKASGMDIELLFAEDMDSGRELTQDTIYDCIFLDYNLPGGSGMELLKFIKSNKNSSPVIIVTSQGDEKIAVEAMKNGASDYIPKNLLSAEGLAQSLRFVLKMQESEAEKIRIQHELQITQKRLETVVANSPIILFLLDKDGNFTLFEGKGISETGINTKSQVGKPLESIASVIPITRSDFTIAINGDDQTSVYQVGEKFYEVYYSSIKNDDNDITGVIGVASDITIHKLAEEELKNAKQYAEDIANTKQQFLANMSHEIRTPLNGITGLTSILLGTSLDNEQMRYMKSIKTCSDNLLVIINDVLDLSKIEAGKMNFENVAFSVEEIVKHATELFLPQAGEKNIYLKYNLDKKLPGFVSGDPTRLSQIIINLVSNAVKFTSEGGVTIDVSLRSQRDDNLTLDFEITDTGIGISEASQSSIFESFTQASNDTTRKYGGTGLGLTIVKRLVELQGGVIGIRSKVGQGTKFFFHVTFNKISGVNTENANGKREVTTDISHLRILIAEDNKINQMIVQKLFADWKTKVEFAENGKICIEKLRLGSFDLILMDIQMPEMDGNTAARIIRSELPEPNKSIPIMAMTAHATGTEKQKCFNSGMNDYICKPFDPAELKRKLIELTSSKTFTIPSAGDTQSPQNELHQKKNNLPVSAVSKVNQPTAVETRIDLTYLKQVGGDKPSFIMEMIEMFLQNTPEALEEMNEKFRQKNWEDLKNVAHRIKPSFTFVGLNGIHRMLADIEECSGTQSNLDMIPGLISQVEAQSQAAFAALETELKKLK